MKHLRLLNIVIVMLMLTAWVPVPQLLATAPGMPAAALAGPVLNSPANGAVVDGYRPEFKWAQPAYPRNSYNIVWSFDSTFKNLSKQIAQRSAADVAVGGIVSFVPDFDLPSNSLIYWRVQAVTGGGNSAWSLARNVKTKPLPVGGGLTPTGGVDVHTLRPTLSWTATADPLDAVLRTNQFDIQVIKKDGGTTVKTALVTGNTYPFTTDLARDTDYQWRVRSHGKYALGDYSGYQDFSTPNPPTVPVLLAPANGYVIPAATDPVFDWKDSTTTSGNTFTYTLEISSNSKFTSLLGAPVTGILDSTYTYSHTIPTGTYYWRVAAVDSTGAMSNYSLVRSFKTQPSLRVVVRDMLTKQGIPDASVLITGIAQAQTTDANGVVYVPVLPAGTKSATATKADYITKKVSTSVPAGVAKELIVEMVHVPMTVVLTWMDPYQNLDLHLWIPEAYTFGGDDEGGHVMADHRGSTKVPPYAQLSGDALKGGPKTKETITIQNRYPGMYVIGVYSYYKSSFFGSGANVKVYKGGLLMQSFDVPAQLETNTQIWWHVADINTGGVLDPVSQLLNDSPGPYDPDGGTFAVPGR